MNDIGTLLFYFLPFIVAYFRSTKNISKIFLLNLLIAWTGIGWIVLIIWACLDDKE